MAAASLGVVAMEIMTYTSALPQLIRSGKTSALVSLVETGKTAGMQLMDESLEKLVKTGVIDGKVAYMRALDKKRFESYISGG